MRNDGLIPGVEPISDDLRPAYKYDLIENYEGESDAIFRARSVSAFGKQIDDVFYEMTDTDRIRLDSQLEIFAPIPDEQVLSVFFGL
ncbi:hypothetical protein [Sphingomonas crocodyli]|uniref:Uncharacterized protein n=1 Tax=Sphingomonas crocodyli TaxID=1979270 RepID=A0A437LXK4_9SPHN|nr:hypothetical protein [Sphingomonas crocodyli]RVT90129.1 hypothetical protein EOD43_17620 [Sphingomonas crocodyli]